MAVPQAYLDQLRSQFGAGMGSVRNSDQRSADQNNTQSGNPNLINNQPQYTSPLARQQFFGSLAQDPTNVRYQGNYQQQPPQQGQPGMSNMPQGYAAPTPTQQPTGWGGQPQLGGYGSMPPTNGQPQLTSQQLQLMQQMQQQQQGQQQPQGYGSMAPQNMAQSTYGGGMQQMPPVNYNAPRMMAAVNQQQGGGFTNGGAPGQSNLTPGYGGGSGNSRYLRPMYR